MQPTVLVAYKGVIMKKSLLMIGILALIMLPIVLPAADSTANDPLMGAVEFGSEENPERVWKTGRIERIDEEGMVVNDIGYQFTTHTKYYSATGNDLSRMNFFSGTSVKFVLEKDMKTVVSLIKQ